jgi:hypothetical protein
MAEKDLRTGDYRDTSGRSLLERDFGGEGEAYRLAYRKEDRPPLLQSLLVPYEP